MAAIELTAGNDGAGRRPVSSHERLLERLRRLVAGRGGVEEKRMVGGRSFSLYGRLSCGVNRAGLLVRVGQSAFEAALTEPHVMPMVLGGRTLGGYVVVAAAGVATDEALAAWVQRGFDVAAAEQLSAAGSARAVAAGSGVDAGPDPEAASVAARFADVAEHLRSARGVGRPQESGGHGFGSGALTVDGSIFAMLTRGRLVVKLPAPRVVELIGQGDGEPFTAGKATPMREWIVVVTGDPSVWRALAEEALAFVGSGGDGARAGNRRPHG